MSNFVKQTKHPESGTWHEAQWLDNYYGPHLYGVQFPSGEIFDPEKVELETRNPAGGFDPENCGYCRKRGSACAKHGGTPTATYIKKADRAPKINVSKHEEAEARQRLANSGAHTGKVAPPAPDFKDPYGCSMCARKGSLCDLHERMLREQEAKGGTTTHSIAEAVTAPQVPAGVKATEQQVGQFRIVQIKVGEVVITIKEPLK